MNKKITLIGILTVFLLISLSVISVANSSTTKQNDSPLYGIRTKKAIGDSIKELMGNIRSSYLEERIFLVFSWLKFKQSDEISLPTPGKGMSCGTACKGCR